MCADHDVPDNRNDVPAGQPVAGATTPGQPPAGAPAVAEPGRREKVKDDLYKLRHSLAHVLAQAVLQIRPEAKLGFGPPIEDGFYYDFDFGDDPITEDDLKDLESRMKKILKEDQVFGVRSLAPAEASQMLADKGETYKVQQVEKLANLGETEVTFWKNGPFEDLCEGPHVESTRKIPFNVFRLDRISGSYWLGDENNPQLTRIYGVAFESKDRLKSFLHWREEARKRDHRVVGKRMELFSFHEQGRGFPFYLANGMSLRDALVDFWKKLHRRRGYEFVSTPTILKRTLWETSGHWDNYRENMYALQIDDEDVAVKPMNCPGGMLIYTETPKSFRDLPLRVAELGHVHRHEKSGVLDGLRRVRAFTQDDAHIFMTPEQITDEVLGVVDLADTIYGVFGLTYELFLSTRPAKAIGDDALWEAAEDGLRKALDAWGRPYTVNEGDGAFYGPKIDFMLQDALQRKHQCGTIQLDMALPERFDLTYVGSDNADHRVVMLHRALYGSLDRFMGILIEHYAGAFPTWLAPVQARVMPITDEINDYGREVLDALIDVDLRADGNFRSDKVNRKIRDAGALQIPYCLVVGKQEAEKGTVAPRGRDGSRLDPMPLADFVAKLKEENDPFSGRESRWRRASVAHAGA